MKDYYALLDQINELEERLNKMQQFDKQVGSVSIPLWKQVLEQKDFYRGHGQLEISEMDINTCMQLLEDLEDNYKGTENMFYVKLFNDLGASIYQANEEDTLWLSIGKVNL